MICALLPSYRLVSILVGCPMFDPCGLGTGLGCRTSHLTARITRALNLLIRNRLCEASPLPASADVLGCVRPDSTKAVGARGVAWLDCVDEAEANGLMLGFRHRSVEKYFNKNMDIAFGDLKNRSCF